LINIFTVDAAIRSNAEDENDLIPQKYCGLDRFEARKQMITDLEALGLLEKIADHKLMVPRRPYQQRYRTLITDQCTLRLGRWQNLRLLLLKTATSSLCRTTGKHLF